MATPAAGASYDADAEIRDQSFQKCAVFTRTYESVNGFVVTFTTKMQLGGEKEAVVPEVDDAGFIEILI